MFDFAKIKNPVLDKRPSAFVRDVAVVHQDGIFRCFHTTAVEKQGRRRLYLEMSASKDLIEWEKTERLTDSTLNFSSPGNIIRHDDEWHMCVQSYPIPPGSLWANNEARLWLMHSRDLTHWSEPDIMIQNGCACRWANSPRQIDPFLVQHDDEYFCFYKAMGRLGAIKSRDLKNWVEASPDRPIISEADTPDNSTIENPCIIKSAEGGYILFFSPCRKGRGIGVAQSDDLMRWKKFKYLDFPELSWAKNGPTAPSLIDTRPETGCWMMFFHGEDKSDGHSAAVGTAWSRNLMNWHVP